MAMYHVKADGAMGVCKAQEGHCPFGGDSGVKHFTSITEAQAYAEGIIKNTTDGGMKMTKTKDEESPTPTPTMIPTAPVEPRMTKNKWGLNVTTWPPEQGVHSATYLGWGGDDTIINAGGWIDGEYIAPTDELGLDRAWKSLSPELKDELDSFADGSSTPAEWNGKILELEKSGDLSPEDEKILEAFWIEGECFNGSVTIYGRDDDVSGLDEDDLERLGLNRMTADELWHMGIIVDDDDDDEDEDE